MSLARYLEKVPLSALHFKLLLVGMLAYMFAGMNTVLIAPALDLISRELRLDPFYTGLLITSFYIGMFLGAFTCGYLSDRVGRRKMMILTTLIHTIFTALFSQARDFSTAFIIRLIAGYGAGGLLPLPGVYVAEFTPARYRGRFLGLVETSWVFGALDGRKIIAWSPARWATAFAVSIILLVLGYVA